ncbi:hypothetical protein GbCGDNIH2_8120 [Granulibacter bethesdensis]|nr:hypothetical protein GbCGDNIH2_8120 [Granulibacter bethesdensis]
MNNERVVLGRAARFDSAFMQTAASAYQAHAKYRRPESIFILFRPFHHSGGR